MYRKYPYTNFHDINLDYILKQIKILKQEYNEIKDIKDEINNTFDNLQNDIITLQNMYTALLENNNAFKNEVRDSFTALSNDIINTISSLESSLNSKFINYTIETNDKFNKLSSSVNLTINAFNRQLVAMDRKLDETLNNLWMSLKMVNPFTGQEESVLSVIDYLASLHMADGITANEYDLLELSAQVYDDKQLTAREYDTQANILLRQ